ncbi:MAG TPA: SGNH/GDSL hydrolase family protein [Mobilitalea sp.]|nr:SGNH/GDSL hydrolase family protein [Mobilitalea sp.]
MDSKFETMNLEEEFDRGIIHVGNTERIQKVMKKAISGEAIKVGFIGGSITAGAAATTPETCYAYLVYSWWKQKFGQSKVEYMNAGVGATTSKFGVARVDQDLLHTEPDMVFAEFSVNDTDSDLFMETFEGLIRKILLHPKKPGLFMFNNVFYDDGHNAQRIHNMVGKYYDLPIVSIKESIYAEIEKGTLLNTDISGDNLHPNDFGHSLVAGVIIHLLEKIYESVSRGDTCTGEYQMPSKPLTANKYITSLRRYNKNTDPQLGGFVKDEKVYSDPWNYFRNGWSAKAAGSNIRFEVEAAAISIQYRKYANHPAPIAKAIIDGKEEEAVILDANFEETWGDCLYLQDIAIYDTVRLHTIEIVITQAALDKEFYLASVITA